MNLFSFGTLMDAELLSVVSGQELNGMVREHATVDDRVALWVVDDHYPVLVARPGARTNGIIIRGLCTEALNRIIFFEGGEFSVQSINVRNASGLIEQVQYFEDTEQVSISDRVWQLEDWQRDTKPDTMPRVHRYMQCYGKMCIEEADAYW